MGNSIFKFSAGDRPLDKVRLFSPQERPAIERIPSPKCQTLLYQAAMEHLWGTEHFATLVLISETFRNSSFGANLLMNFQVNRETIDLFNNILTPQKCLSLQFILSLTISLHDGGAPAINFSSQLINTKYFHLQLQTLRLVQVGPSITSLFFGNKTKWTQLKSLSLSSVAISDVDLEAVIDNLTNSPLTNLDLVWCEGITDAGLRAIAAKPLPSLSFLQIYWCSRITEAGVRPIVSFNTSSLTALSFSLHERVSDLGIQHIAEKLTALTKLELRLCETEPLFQCCCSSTTTTTTTFTGESSPSPPLTACGVSGAGQITDVSFQHIAENLKELTSLDVGGEACFHITDVGLQAIAENLSSLTSLGLSQCHNVTDEGIQIVVEKIPSLTSLNLMECSRITNAAIERFKITHPPNRQLE